MKKTISKEIFKRKFQLSSGLYIAKKKKMKRLVSDWLDGSLRMEKKKNTHADLSKTMLFSLPTKEEMKNATVKHIKMGLTEEEIKKELETAIREAKEILRRDKISLILDAEQRFFSKVLSEMKTNITTEVPCAAVNVINAIANLYINPKTYSALEKRERLAILIHEILHIVLNHVFRYPGVPGDARSHYLWNLATDCIINQLVPNNSTIKLPDWVFFPETFKKWGIHMPLNLTANEYYKILNENKDKIPDNLNGGAPPMVSFGDNQEQSNQEGDSQQQQNGEDSQEENKSKGQGEQEGQEKGTGSSKQENEESQKNEKGAGAQGVGESQSEEEKYPNWHSKWEESEGSKKVNQDVMKNLLRKAYNQAAGNLSSDLRRQINDILDSKIPWDKHFRMLYGRYLRADFVRTIRRESRRLGELAKGRRSENKLHAVVIADTSASIGEEHLAQFSGHLVKIYKAGVKVTVIAADSEVNAVYEFKGKLNTLDYRGGGGTSFIPAFKYIQEKKLKADLVIYLTDGWGTAPAQFKIPTIWCLTPGGKKPDSIEGGPVKFGKVIEMN